MNESPPVVHLTLRVPAPLHQQVKQAAKLDHSSVHGWLLRLAEAKVRELKPQGVGQ